MNLDELLKEICALKDFMEEQRLDAETKISENYYAGAINAYDNIIKLIKE